LRVLLVGESNPFGGDPEFALWPDPPQCSGGRLARILLMSDREYLRTFDRANLMVGARWTLRMARKRTNDFPHHYRVLLGAKVTRAHGIEFKPFTRFESWVILPHPSGLSRLWNDRDAAPRARDLVSTLVADASSAA
jgi:hypothetical protein